jgi:DNA-binding CsgD family transcriptional regulator
VPLRASDGSLCTLLTQAEPVVNSEHQIIAIAGKSLIISDQLLVKKTEYLRSFDFQLFGIRNKFFQPIHCYQFYDVKLTKMQTVCLFYLMRGKSTKKIAHILNRSIRTIEHHIETIRQRVGASTQSDLINKAVQAGLLQYLPLSNFIVEE